ncbi:hypothetical protein ACQEVS_25770 [Streptomyces sp. CA-181903]|uniref:hypothetical protein n=1 Tax=Streptomyces sp. CA-181903 TaxID=3240055 RepID=UPI003D93B38D
MPLLFLNEKSWATACDRPRADAAMAGFVDVVRAVAKEDPTDTSLVSEVDLKALEVAEGYSIGKWIGSSPKNHARWQRLLSLRNRSPIRSVYPAPDADGNLEYRHHGDVALGLGAAHFMDGMAVSLPVAPQWEAPFVILDRSELVELDDGTLKVEHANVEARHLSAVPHADDHRSWIRESSLARAATGRQIWERKDGLYPHLQFLPCTEAMLTGLDPHWIVPVRRCLERLEAAVALWDPETRPEPEWQTKVTPESRTRKKVCWFSDMDGFTRLFELHARFTPGMGRVYFRLVPEERGIRLAHIGSKIRPDL